ncbi:hypothetical protein VIGAN_01225600 [Vigna angularis var. angularis]|uniref:Uncharacterized protein n=1 Tax=Vigna angularis var. angularis TaxID=157739 RepID=A0A0S3R249_PHAAN|nr:hypothetical protein VIGAN_01225600 [Vigna angularis var. angularis]
MSLLNDISHKTITNFSENCAINPFNHFYLHCLVIIPYFMPSTLNQLKWSILNFHRTFIFPLNFLVMKTHNSIKKESSQY